jgi:hypothetical protein
MQGDLPVPCRAHTATLVDRRIILFGGGRGPVYFDHLYVLDTGSSFSICVISLPGYTNYFCNKVNYRWTKLDLPHPRPCARRAHTAVYYQGRLIIFGGGDGGQALNDVWALDVTRDPEQWTWEELKTKGWKSKLRDDDEPGEIPRARGYQTTDLVGNVMVVMGGSDGIESFSDIWVLDLGVFPCISGPKLCSLPSRRRIADMERSKARAIFPTTIAYFDSSRVLFIFHGRTRWA